jgi:ATP-dependent Clp protease ATP-binding subunit ClpC
MKGYNFTERARRVFTLAREEAVRLQCAFVGPDHLLLGVIREGEGLGAVALRVLAGDLEALRLKVEAHIPHGNVDPPTPDLPYTAKAKRVLERAMEVALDLGHTYLATEHILLGYLSEGGSPAAASLNETGVTFERAQATILRLLGDPRGDSGGDSDASPVGAAQRMPVALSAEIVVRLSDGRVIRQECGTLREAVTFLFANGMT